jgi:AcrR family transcriptional regulator
MRRTRAEAKSANRQALLDAARVLVSRDGAAVPLEAIAAAADLTTGAVYSIFGSKRDLLVALVSENVDRIGVFLDDIGPDLTLGQAVACYVDAWLASYGSDTAARNLFELQVLIEAAQDERLTAKLGEWAREDLDGLAQVFAGRLLDGAADSARSTAEQGREVAQAVQATITGYAVREVLGPQDAELIRRSCTALAALASPVADGERDR